MLPNVRLRNWGKNVPIVFRDWRNANSTGKSSMASCQLLLAAAATTVEVATASVEAEVAIAVTAAATAAASEIAA